MNANVEGYPNYHVTKDGEVYNIKKNKKMKQTIALDGYYVVGLSNKKHKQFRVNRLVAMVYLDNPDNKPCVNHIDGNKLNNELSNLEWCTFYENRIHALETGLVKLKLTDEDVHIVKQLIEHEKVKEIAGLFGVEETLIYQIRRGERY